MLKKLGPHILGTSAAGSEWTRRGAPIVKMVGDFSFATEAETLPHHPLIVGRVFENAFDPNQLLGTDPVAMAATYTHQYLSSPILLNPSVKLWEGPNECVITDTTAMRWYATFLAEFARILRVTFNRTAVIGGWAVGNPDYPLWAEYHPALVAAVVYKAMLGRHSYAGPDQSTWSYLLLRHREDNLRFSAMGYPNLPVLITECGADGVPFGVPPGKSWKELFNGNAEQYLNSILLPLDNELAKDNYVLGATVFTLGAGWNNHNIEGQVASRLIELAAPPPASEWIGATVELLPLFRNMRFGPGSSFKPFAAGYGGSTGRVLDEMNNFLLIEIPKALWVHKSGVKKVNP